MMPKALRNGRFMGVITARAVTPVMAAVVMGVDPLFVSSPDLIPPQQARRRPGGGHALDQESAGGFGLKCDALGLPAFERQCVEPVRLPAVVETVEQPEWLALQMH